MPYCPGSLRFAPRLWLKRIRFGPYWPALQMGTPAGRSAGGDTGGELGSASVPHLRVVHHIGRTQPGGRLAPPDDKAGLHWNRSRSADSTARDAPVKDLRFTHLTTVDGLSQGYVTAILQDRRGFMWFATRDGLNRYDGNTFLAYKHNPNDSHSLNSNFIQDLAEDDHGNLWIATNTGVNKFDPTTERFTRCLSDPDNPSIQGVLTSRA